MQRTDDDAAKRIASRKEVQRTDGNAAKRVASRKKAARTKIVYYRCEVSLLRANILKLSVVIVRPCYIRICEMDFWGGNQSIFRI